MILRLNERQFINTEQISFVNIEKTATCEVYRVHFAGGFSHSWRPESEEAKAVQNWIDRTLGDGMFDYAFALPTLKESVRGNHLETLAADRDLYIERYGAENVGEIVARRKILPLEIAAQARRRNSQPVWKHQEKVIS